MDLKSGKARRRGLRFAGMAVLAALALAGGAAADAGAGRQPTVVELFTSQGCSSCPPANVVLAALSERPDVLALSFSVTYWDRLGWKDTFGQPAFTERQRAYEPALGESGPFTPQVVVDGQADAIGSRRADVEALIARSRRAGPALMARNGRLAIGDGEAPAGGADIWLVRYDPRRIDVPIGRGENRGRTVPHKNVVHELTRVGRWTGAPYAVDLPPASGPLRTAVLVQMPSGGPILAAWTE